MPWTPYDAERHTHKATTLELIPIRQERDSRGIPKSPAP
jgi:hypothetical protein